MRILKTLLRPFIVVSFLTSCATGQLGRFETVGTGMDKTDVVDAVGSPTRSGKWKGRTVWVYQFYKDKKPVWKEIHFKDQVVVYTGVPVSPLAPPKNGPSKEAETSANPVSPENSMESKTPNGKVIENNGSSGIDSKKESPATFIEVE
ncbi:MAG: hypothetical protein COT74_05275 [Bdellovibrionales bacterium CG10_big_fil_rev_8_21_14_0_10_45_34]|nr:MAG: hypothetical protein COT74_05275 [Bdellovibrionales bacterium CG10_big_fil_rev_8_21_14_0_10_45_34]